MCEACCPLLASPGATCKDLMAALQTEVIPLWRDEVLQEWREEAALQMKFTLHLHYIYIIHVSQQWCFDEPDQFNQAQLSNQQGLENPLCYQERLQRAKAPALIMLSESADDPLQLCHCAWRTGSTLMVVHDGRRWHHGPPEHPRDRWEDAARLQCSEWISVVWMDFSSAPASAGYLNPHSYPLRWLTREVPTL